MKKRISEVMNMELSKSKKMVALYELGLEIKEIAAIMGVRYNFVYNVISNNCRMNGVELRTSKKPSKKSEVIKLLEEGKSLVEISAELRISYTRVHAIRKEYEASKVENAVSK